MLAAPGCACLSVHDRILGLRLKDGAASKPRGRLLFGLPPLAYLPSPRGLPLYVIGDFGPHPGAYLSQGERQGRLERGEAASTEGSSPRRCERPCSVAVDEQLTERLAEGLRTSSSGDACAFRVTNELLPLGVEMHGDPPFVQ